MEMETVQGAEPAWLVTPKVNEAADARLICFPYAGGGVPVFRNWHAPLAPRVEVSVAQLPGRGSRIHEKPHTRLAPIVEALLAELRGRLDKPLLFFGHSLGALVAFEVSRAMRRSDLPMPQHLLVSGRGAPHLSNPNPPLHHLPDDQLLSALGKLNGTPADLLAHRELMQLMLPVIRADFEAGATYLCPSEPPLPVPITVFGGLADPRWAREHLQAWQAQTTAAFEVKMVEGDHFFLNTESGRAAIIASVLKSL